MMPVKCALYLCTDTSDRKMAKFVISDPENPGYSFIRKKFLRGGATLVQECQNFKALAVALKAFSREYYTKQYLL